MTAPLPGGSTIRFEDLGAPVQKLLRSLHSDLSDDDMKLLNYVSVKDMAKIFNELGINREVELIWQELRTALLERKSKAEQKKMEREESIKQLERETQHQQAQDECAASEEDARQVLRKAERKSRKDLAEDARRLQEEYEEYMARLQQEEQVAIEEAERRKEERRQRRLEEKARAQAEEEAERRREDAEEEKKREKRRRRAEEKAQRLAEQQRLASIAHHTSTMQLVGHSTGVRQKDQWEEHVKNHPLEYSERDLTMEETIEQKQFARTNVKPRTGDADGERPIDVMKRICTPKCITCKARFAKIPHEWFCPLCMHRLQIQSLCWQSDDEVKDCQVCKVRVGRFSRHHCRNCGRVVCGACSPYKATIPHLGYVDPVKVCSDCYATPAGV